MENIDLYLNNSSAFTINAGSGGGNPWHDEKGMFTTGPSTSMGSFGEAGEKEYKKYGSPFNTKITDFSSSSRESKKFQEAHSILHLAADDLTRTCSYYRDETKNIYGMKQNQKSFIEKMSNSGWKIKFLSNKIAELSMQSSSDKNAKEIRQRIKQIDLALEKAKKNVEIGDKLLKSFKAEIKRGNIKSADEINGMAYSNEAAHASIGALNTLKYIASSLIEK